MEREVGPRFAEAGSFEYEYGQKWKQLYDMKQEKERIVQERERREKDHRDVEAERRKREEKEGKVRDEHIKEREKQVNSQRENEAGKGKMEDKAAWEEQRRADMMDADERNNR